MVQYYFDIETTGIDPRKDKIITIQWQRLNESSGDPVGELQILKEWETSERDILATFLPQIQCENCWDFVPIGKNLLFDFNFLDKRAGKHGLNGFDLACCYSRPHLDLKHVLVLINQGKFRGYDKVLDVGGHPVINESIPQLYERGMHQDIIEYIRRETGIFLRGLKILKREMPALLVHFKDL